MRTASRKWKMSVIEVWPVHLKTAVRRFIRCSRDNIIRGGDTLPDISSTRMPGCVDVGLEGDMALYDPMKGRRKIYKYDKVFGVDSTQQEVYEDTKALIRSVLDGRFFSQDHLAAP